MALTLCSSNTNRTRLLRPAVLLASVLLLLPIRLSMGEPISDTIRSPTIASLAASIQNNDAAALEEFWKSAKARRGLLIEESNVPTTSLYTFLWRASVADLNYAVRLTANFTQRNRGGNDQLRRLPNSDVWYASYELPRQARIGYAFIVPSDSNPAADIIGIQERGGMNYGMYRDPLNPKSVDAIGARISLASGPEAVTSPYLEEAIQTDRGSMTTIEIKSETLQGRRRVDIYTPAGYAKSSKQLPFVLMYDGDEYQRSIPTPRILDNLIAARKIPPTVVAFFHSPNREEDLMPGATFQKFIVAELMPRLRSHFRLSRDPKRNVVAGYSLGGLAAINTATNNPRIFGNVISQSGSLWWASNFFDAPDFVPGQYLNSNSGQLIKTYAESEILPIRFYLEAGQWEEAGGLLPNRLFASVLKGKGYRVQYQEFIGAHDSYSWKETLPTALIYVLN